VRLADDGGAGVLALAHRHLGIGLYAAANFSVNRKLDRVEADCARMSQGYSTLPGAADPIGPLYR
jgi:hypothetical protein